MVMAIWTVPCTEIWSEECFKRREFNAKKLNETNMAPSNVIEFILKLDLRYI